MPSKDPARRREVYRMWYLRHREKKIKQVKEYYEQNKSKIRQRQREYYQKDGHKKLLNPEWRRRRKERLREYRKELRERLKAIFGDKCYVCVLLEKAGKKVGCYSSIRQKRKRGSLQLHEINGKEHPRSYSYYVKHKDSLVPLCMPHHRCIHFCTDALGLKWNDIITRLDG